MLFHILIELYKMLSVEDLEVDYDEILRQAHMRILRPVENSLIKRYPMIGDEWDNEINNGAKAEYFTVSSAKRIKWKCTKCENIWECTISNRTEFKTGCPKCGFNIFDGKIHKSCAKRKPGLSLITFI